MLRAPMFLLFITMSATLVLFSAPQLSNAHLQIGFYSRTCPQAENIISNVVKHETKSDPTLPAALLRLHFHDCFVNGCDGSILISKPDRTAEKDSVPQQGLRGFEAVEMAKAQLEHVCPGVVSCSDIVALMARDSIFLSNGPMYNVPTGRRDGFVSNMESAAPMPDVKDSVEILKSKFVQKGLSHKDLVVLNAAHTIGTTACFFIYDRLYPSGPRRPDRSINRNLLPLLLQQCPDGGENTVRLPLDNGSEMRFDIQIFNNIRQGFGVLSSDTRLYQNQETKIIIDSYLQDTTTVGDRSFQADFVDSIVRMGMIGVLTGNQGEIRKTCSSFN